MPEQFKFMLKALPRFLLLSSSQSKLLINGQGLSIILTDNMILKGNMIVPIDNFKRKLNRQNCKKQMKKMKKRAKNEILKLQIKLSTSDKVKVVR